MNRTKMEALVHYVIANCDPSRLGATKLSKILWYCDTVAYRMHGESMTGERYVKRQHGPVPYHLVGMLAEMEKRGLILINTRSKGGYPMKEYVPLREPDLSSLSSDELALIDELRIAICDGHSAASISELTHDEVWDAANMGEDIPMFAVFASRPGEITDAVLEWADSVIETFDSGEPKAA